MGDEPLAELGGMTPLEAAVTPMLDELSPKSRLGMVRTIPQGMSPGSDIANLAVLGFDPRRCYTGRSPLEAISIGIDIAADDVALRLNLVTLSAPTGVSSDGDTDFGDLVISDHSAGDITTEEAYILLEALKSGLANDDKSMEEGGDSYLDADFDFSIHTGTGYRHCLLWKKGAVLPLTPPHDVLGQTIISHLPTDPRFLSLMKKSYRILQNHPLNQARREVGKNPGNCIWFWGAGTKPRLTDFYTKTGQKGIVVSAVDLLKGIGLAAGMNVPTVPGANATINTNYAGKVNTVLRALLNEDCDFAFIHIEAPDEAGHKGDLAEKIRAIEYVDQKVVAPLYQRLQESGLHFRLLVMTDHMTPIRVRTHTSEPVPFLLYDSEDAIAEAALNDNSATPPRFCEKDCLAGGDYIEEGHLLIEELLKKNGPPMMNDFQQKE
jgi:2,3-bisphosphoglycerate-independent phosphoglycerate mutase